MIIVEDIVREYLSRESRHFNARICFEDNKVVSGTVRSLTIEKGSCSNHSFQPQAIFSNHITATIDNCTDTLKGKKLRVEIGVTINGVDYWHNIATVYATKAPRKGNRTTLEGEGAISAKMGRKFTNGTYTTVGGLIDAISQYTGITITIDDNHLSGLTTKALPEGTIYYGDYYIRELLSYIAGLGFGYVTENANGNVVIRSYKYEDGTITSSPSRVRKDPDFHDISKPIGIEVTGLDDKQFITGDLQNVSLTNPLMTQEIFDAYKNNFLDIEYQPADIDLTLGDFTIEPNDLISFTDREGVAHTVKCMSIKHNYTGGLKTSISSPTLDSGEDYARTETGKQSNTAYNALISGNFGSGESEPVPSLQRFTITGNGISNGFGWVDNGEIYFIDFTLSIPATFSYVRSGQGTAYGRPSYAEAKGNATITGLNKSLNVLTGSVVNGVIPAPSGGGGIAYTVTLSFNSTGFSWVMSLQSTSGYVDALLGGNIYAYNNGDGTYSSLVSGDIPVRLFLISTSELYY